MSQSIARWIPYTESNVNMLLETIRQLPRPPFSNKLIADKCGIDVFELSRILNQRKSWAVLKRDQYRKAINFLSDYEGINFLNASDDGLISSDIMYMGMGRFFEVSPEDVDYAVNNMVGTYEAYRYSYRLRALNVILRGVVKIVANKERNAVIYEELYRIQHEPGLNDGAEMFFERKGVVIYTPNMTKIFCNKTDTSRDFETIYIREILPAGYGTNKNRINTMSGIITDWQRRDFYATSVYLSRIDEKLSKTLNPAGYAQAFRDDDPEVKAAVQYMKVKFNVDSLHLVHLSST